MTLADEVRIRDQDGHVTSDDHERREGPEPSARPERPKRRTFTAAYKQRILAAYDELPDGSAERGALLRRERLYHSHLEHWRAQQAAGALPSSRAKPASEADREQLARLRAENKKLAECNERLTDQLRRTKTALDIAGKAYALLENISSSADIDGK